jgi:hypothetical protein
MECLLQYPTGDMKFLDKNKSSNIAKMSQAKTQTSGRDCFIKFGGDARPGSFGLA